MSERVYYMRLKRKEFEDPSLKEMRRMAISHMQAHMDVRTVTIYSSSTMRMPVGEVLRRPTQYTVFAWRYESGGRTIERPLMADGNIRHGTEL